MDGQTSPSYSVTMRLEIQDRPGMFGRIASAIGACGGNLGAVDLVGSAKGIKIRDVTVNCHDDAHASRVTATVGEIEGVRLVRWWDRVFRLHLGGKIAIANKIAVNNRDALSMAYTPGVARICRAIAIDPERAWNLTIKRNTVAVVTDGTAVLGLGDLGAAAALPVMEGKAMLFKEFGGVDAFPICLDTRDSDEIVRIVKAIAPQFGGINLEDISAPRCFDIEQRLRNELDIPVFHDDQHGTAVVVAAALKNAVKLLGKRMEDLRVVVLGIGAAGVACTRFLLRLGVTDLIGVDRAGAIHRGRTEHMNPAKQWFAEHTNPRGIVGGLAEACDGADLFLGVSGPGLLTVEHVERMKPDRIIFALANPDPEIEPSLIEARARVIATGRSDYPNQINNVLCFPGLFRGCLDVRARAVNDEMLLAACEAIASTVSDQELAPDYIIPSPFDQRVAKAVAKAVAEAANRTGVARLWDSEESVVHHWAR
ncbi:MAG: NAD-dependent malic enzyme [Phycisphaerae bacterium]|nr:NAD-dependent malic enzyme [Phycisphaerae bacterium]